MLKEEIISKLKELTNHKYISITNRGNSAIKSSLSSLPKNSTILIPKEGGWLTYRDIPPKLGLETIEIACNEAKIDLDNLTEILKLKPGAFLYQNPGGYFAEQPLKEIYQLCQENNCLVILDVSGSIGTELCNGDYADIIVSSFGRWKPVNAEVGGFISFKDGKLFEKIKINIEKLDDEDSLKKIKNKLDQLPQRISFLQDKRKKIIKDLENFNLVRADEWGLVVVVKFSDDIQKQKLIKYCQNNNLEYTECPRYIRLNQKAISIEVKRL